MLYASQDGEFVMTTDANSFVLPPQYPQINVYLRGLATSPSTRLNNNIILLRVHTVGENPEQLVAFKSGLNEIKRKYPNVFQKLVIDYLNNDIIRCNRMTPSDVVNWLLGGHIHILLGHFHQGRNLEDNVVWNVRGIEMELLRLKFHLGNPNDMKVHDPVLLQDKFNYMAAIKQYVLPTAKVPLVHGKYAGLKALIKRFCETNVNNDDPELNGYVVKVPYTTNQKYRKLQNVDDIFNSIIRYRDRYVGVIPYVMLQAYLHDSVEYKVVCFDGKALYEANIGNCCIASKTKKTFATKIERFEFAEKVLEAMKLVCPFTQLSSLVRVDIFYCKYLNMMVVNELESLEARIDATGKDFNKEMFARQLLSIYHANKMLDCLSRQTHLPLEMFEYPKWPFVSYN